MISSLVSFAKRDIHEFIPGMFVSDYILPTSDKGTILHVDDSFYWKPDPLNDTHDQVIVSSEQLVRSIVHMHITSQLGYKPNEYPALFCVPNRAVTLDELETDKDLKSLKFAALSAQRKWFISLVKLADDDWQQLRRHQMISDIQRTACKELGLKREWLFVVEDENPKNDCPFCGQNLLNPNAPICPTCGKVHNPAKLAEIEARFKTSTKTN